MGEIIRVIPTGTRDTVGDILHHLDEEERAAVMALAENNIEMPLYQLLAQVVWLFTQQAEALTAAGEIVGLYRDALVDVCDVAKATLRRFDEGMVQVSADQKHYEHSRIVCVIVDVASVEVAKVQTQSIVNRLEEVLNDEQPL